MLFTRSGYARFYDATGSWESFTFPRTVTKLRAWCIGTTVDNPVITVRLNDDLESEAFALNVAHTLRIDDHEINKIWFKLDSGSNGKFSFIGLKKRE